MAIAEVGSGSQRAEGQRDNFTTETVDAVFPGNVTSGNLLVAIGAAFGGTGTPPNLTITSTRSAAFTVKSGANEAVIADTTLFVAYAFATSSGACTVSVDPDTASGNYVSYAITEFSGVHATPLDVDDGLTDGGDPPTANITTLTANDLILAGFTVVASPTIDTPTNFTQLGEEEDNTNHQAYHACFRIVTTATTYTPVWTLGSSHNNLIYLVALKEAIPITAAELISLTESAAVVFNPVSAGGATQRRLLLLGVGS